MRSVLLCQAVRRALRFAMATQVVEMVSLRFHRFISAVAVVRLAADPNNVVVC